MLSPVPATLGTLLLVLLISICPANGQGKNKRQKGSSLPAATELGIKGAQFTINGTPTFLYGMSYYGALGASEDFILRDLADMKKYDFNWIRVWANWSAFGNEVSAVDGNGNPREPFFTKLKWLVAECDPKGIIVDVTLSHTNFHAGTELEALESHRKAVEAIIRLLKPYHNWYLDLANERNAPGNRSVSFEELKQLRKTAKQLDPGLLITASAGGNIGISRKDMYEYLMTAQVDFICPHTPRRNAEGPAKTEATSLGYLAWMKEIGRTVPVNFQEPFRRGYTKWQPIAEDYVTALRGAKAGGAAGWCFHNGGQKESPESKPRRSFEMSEKRLFDQLDSEELKAIENIRNIMK